jgi:hypothetical protein
MCLAEQSKKHGYERAKNQETIIGKAIRFFPKPNIAQFLIEEK